MMSPRVQLRIGGSAEPLRKTALPADAPHESAAALEIDEALTKTLGVTLRILRSFRAA